jgi:pyruvyl transferase EpsO
MSTGTGSAAVRSQTGESHRDVISRLNAKIDDVMAPVRHALIDRPFSLIDFPDHGNVGDSAIWQGEMIWLRRAIGRIPSYICRQEPDWPELERVGGPILLHGGGNFGDIWPQHQGLREAVLVRYPRRPVVQMPQSIHYGDRAAINRTAKIIAQHGAFTLLVRDERSLELARERFDCTVALCPDMAFCMGPLSRPTPAARPVLMLLRSDKEKVDTSFDPSSIPSAWRVADWLDDAPGMHSVVKRMTWAQALGTFRPRELAKAPREIRYLENLAKARLQRGLAMLSEARFVITDRLHVHILCTLLGIPHVALDNSYGKIAGFAAAFQTLWDGAYQATDLQQALQIAEAHLG